MATKQISIDDHSVWPGSPDGPGADMTFMVTLSEAQGEPVTVHVATETPAVYVTAGLGAIAGTHYDATAGDVTFAPGEVAKPFTVHLRGREQGRDLTFLANLTAPPGFTLHRPSGAGIVAGVDREAWLREHGHA